MKSIRFQRSLPRFMTAAGVELNLIAFKPACTTNRLSAAPALIEHRQLDATSRNAFGLPWGALTNFPKCANNWLH